MSLAFPLDRKRRVVVAAIACAVLGAASGPAVDAQSYPAKPVRIIVPYGPGTAPDTLARFVGEALSQRMSQTFVVENKPGAGGKLGTEVAASAAPDGYTLFLGSKDTQSVISHLYPSWSVKPDRAFVPIAGIGTIQNVIVTRAASPDASLTDVIGHAKSKEMSYGTPGIGTNLHLLAEYVANLANVKMLHVPYSRSFAEGFPAVVRGDVDLLVAGLPPMLPMIKDGRIKVVAITGTTRSKYVPSVPTFAEQGIPGLDTGGWFALFAPAGTPAQVVERLGSEMTEVVKSPAFVARLDAQAVEPMLVTPAQLMQLIEAERTRWGKLIQTTGIKVE